MVLIMTVEPGFGGQGSLISVCPRSLGLARCWTSWVATWLQIDGGVSVETVERCAAAGVDSFVAGSSVFGAPDPDAMVATLRELAAAAT